MPLPCSNKCQGPKTSPPGLQTAEECSLPWCVNRNQGMGVGGCPERFGTDARSLLRNPGLLTRKLGSSPSFFYVGDDSLKEPLAHSRMGIRAQREGMFPNLLRLSFSLPGCCLPRHNLRPLVLKPGRFCPQGDIRQCLKITQHPTMPGRPSTTKKSLSPFMSMVPRWVNPVLDNEGNYLTVLKEGMCFAEVSQITR